MREKVLRAEGGGVWLGRRMSLHRWAGWGESGPSLLALGLAALALGVFHMLSSRAEATGGSYATAQSSWTTTSVIRGPQY
jgi:hypothetical protein